MKSSQKYTESLIQEILHSYVDQKGHLHIIPNIYIALGEADLVSCTKSGYLIEYEIKVSLADFRNDKNKIQKHKGYASAFAKKGKGVRETVPSRLIYVCPKGLIPEEEIPEYAGLIEVDTTGRYWDARARSKNWYVKEVIKPPKLNAKPISDKTVIKLLRSCYYKYWNIRKILKGNKDV